MSEKIIITEEARREIAQFADGLVTTEEIETSEKAELITALKAGELPKDLPPEVLADGIPTKPVSESTDLRYIISKASMSGKIKLAIFGNSACRAILIFSPNQLIQAAVLRNPRMQIPEIETYAKNPFMSDFVLGQISENKKWASSYSVKRNLIFNPKTPPHVSVKFIRFMLKGDLKTLCKSKDVAQVVVLAARRRMIEVEKGK